MAQKYEGGAGGSISQWTYAQPKTTKSGYPLLTSSDLNWLKQFPEWGQSATATRQPTQPLNTLGDWGGPATPSKDTSTPILGAIDRKLGGSTMPKDNNWSNATTPAQQGDVDVGGGFVPGSAPSAPARSWRPVGPQRAVEAPAARQPSVIGTPIVDIAPAPAPQASTMVQTKVGGPSGFTEQYDAPTAPMPSVDQLYKTYTDMAGENQGMRDYLASPQFQGLWQSGNIPYWMLSDPVWRNYLVKVGLLNWDALARRMGQQ